MDIKVSVIIPVYNAEEYVRECLDSVIGQTLRELEVICVDDGSTDNSLAILEEYAAKDARVRVVNQENQGSGPARNKALDLATGAYVCFMDPDDFYPNADVLMTLFSAIAKYKLDIVGGCAEYVSFDSSVEHKQVVGRGAFENYGVIKYIDVQHHWDYWRYLYSRSFLNENQLRFPNLRRRQDPPFFVAAMIAATKFAAIRDNVYCYRQRAPNSKINWLSNNGVKLRDNLRGLMMVNELAIKNGLQMLLRSNTQCLSHCGAFRKYSELEVVGQDLYDFMSTARTTKWLTAHDYYRIILGGFLNEEPLGVEKLKVLFRLGSCKFVIMFFVHKVAYLKPILAFRQRISNKRSNKT